MSPDDPATGSSPRNSASPGRPDHGLRVGYVVHRFPNLSETFILNEVLEARDQGVECWVISLNPAPDGLVHRTARDLMDAGRVIYVNWPGRFRKLLLLLRRWLAHPCKTWRAWRRIQGRQRWLAMACLELARQADTLRLDRLHAHFANTAAQYALAAHQWSGIPFTVTTHHTDLFYTPPDNYPQLADASDGIVCISAYNRRFLADEYGLPDEKLPLIHCGIRPEEFRGEGPTPAPPESEPLRLLCVARLAPIKGQPYLLQAIRQLLDEGLPCQLTLVGDGPLRDDLQAQCRELGLESLVQFAGFQTHHQVLEHLRACDVFVLPSLSEGIPVSLMEALACEKPVIATDVRGVGELVVDGKTGLTCPAEDAGRLAAAIRAVRQDPASAAARARAGRQFVIEQFNLKTNVEQLIRLWTKPTRTTSTSA